MPKRIEQEDSGSTESLSNITDESESENVSSSEEFDRQMVKRGRPRKMMNGVNKMNFAGPLGNYYQNPPQMPYQQSNMLYRNINPQRSNYMYNPGIPNSYRSMGYPSQLGPSNPSFIGNVSSQFSYYNYPQYRQAYPPQGYQQPSYQQPPPQYNAPYKQPPPFYNFYAQPAHQPPPPVQKYTPPMRVDRERQRQERLKKRKKVSPRPEEQPQNELFESDEMEEVEEDKHEKLLDSRGEMFFVKFRNMSYIHCEWVPREEIMKTRAGAIKAKRFLSRHKESGTSASFEEGRSIQQIIAEDFGGNPPFDPEYIKIDRVISVDNLILVKWKKLAYELSTFEKIEDIRELEGFEEELREYKVRNVVKKSAFPIDYRPPKDALVISKPFKNGNTLRDYQMEGLNWLLNRWYYKQGCIMADEMGLGKTVQTVCFVNKVFETGYQHPVLIVAPLSTLIHWEREFRTWTDLRILLYHGNNVARDLIYDYEFYNDGLLFDVLITTYEMVMSGMKHLSFNFGIGVFDEAHRLKNSHSKAFQSLISLSFNHKILLSGTPLQNNLTELWSLLHFLDPIKNESLSYFLESYKLEKSEDVDRLKTLLKPVMLRRMKDDVEKIPIKEETIVEVELTMIQKQFYRAIIEKNLSIFEKESPNLLNVMMELRKCCIHPYLVRGAEEKIISDYKIRRRIDFIKQRRMLGEEAEDGFARKDEAGGEVKESRMESGESNKEGSKEENRESRLDTPKEKSKERSRDNIAENPREYPEKEREEYPEKQREESPEKQREEYPEKEREEDHGDNPKNDVIVPITKDGITEGNVANADEHVVPGANNEADNAQAHVAGAVNKNTEKCLNGSVRVHGTAEDDAEGAWRRETPTNELTVDEYYKILIQSSGKLVLLDKLLAKLKGEHKVLIFSQMTRCLDLLSDYLQYKRYKYERIDGGVRGECRQAAIDRFSSAESDSFVFLLCTRAGGMGINLTSADTVVIFDSDWNPQNDLQAQARCHRIGQTKSVKIYRLITRNTYEREMFDKAGLKLGLDQAILQKNKSVRKKEHIENLLKKGAYGVLMENDEAAQKFCEEDIEMILERRTHIVRHNQEANQNVFSRASFQVEEEFDDPDFWQNLLSKRKDAENEMKIKRLIRRLGRETPTDYEEIDRVLESTDDEMVKVFLTIFRKGVNGIIENVSDVKEKIGILVRYCYETLTDKNKEDFKLHLEAYFKDDKQLPVDHHIVKKLAEKFLLRLQVVSILKYLYRIESLEHMKGGSVEEDRRIVNWVISNGYDNWPTGVGREKGLFRGKDRNDLNARVRKIILSLNKIKENREDREREIEVDNIVMNYGRVTTLNENDIAENIEEVNKRVEMVMNQKRRKSNLESLYKRIALIDALRTLEVEEIKRTVGLPRGWKKKDDERLVQLVRTKGIANTAAELGLSDEIVVRRLEMLVSNENEE
ncbi:Chromodomain-helicase DNA-binding protein [Trachipleistophora hominis]|uniref:Chromodomain-helicase DNA-binding protein n=1 Tax=Trachipleistophora hominis TaxID=72359 RepID=L7JYJ6_TRAHO|nr:Chromodomain-helicase DNA-binding protein [Trachipleistophora hominis]